MRFTRFAIGALVLLILLSSMGVVKAEGEDSESKIVVESDLQILDIMDVYGGHITWRIYGELAHQLRVAIGKKYGVSTIDIGVASRYFKKDLERVVEENLYGCGYLAFIRINRADPLHDDTQGILNDENDVKGLIGDVNSNSPIVLRMLVRGEPVTGKHTVTSLNISFAPFYAAISNESQISQFNLHNVSVEVKHREIMAGIGSFALPQGTFRLRLVVAEFFMASGGWVEYRSFDILNSPILLFIYYLITVYGLGVISGRFRKGKEGTLMEKKVSKYTIGLKVTLLILYLIIPFDGIIYIIVLGASLGASIPIIRKLYGA